MNNNYGLVYPSQDAFYNVDVFNNNFSKLADGIDILKSGCSKSCTVVAAHNSQNPLKECADFVCGTDDCSATLQKALEQTAVGGEILFLDGSYYLENYFNINKSVTVRGMGGRTTKINKHEDMPPSANMLFRVTSENVTIKDIGLYNIIDGKDVHCLGLFRSGQVVDNCVFVKGEYRSDSGMNHIYMSSMGGYVRVSNCIFEKYDDEQYSMLIEDVWYGSIYGNCCVDIDSNRPIPLRIYIFGNRPYDNIGFGAQNDAVYVNGVPKN